MMKFEMKRMDEGLPMEKLDFKKLVFNLLING
jgi:hypothetical protein